MNTAPARRSALTLAFAVLSFAAPARAQQTGPTPAATRLQWWDRHVALRDASLLKGARWQFLGPTNISGRATDAAIVEPKGMNYTIYLAEATGGLWKSSNEGVTWEPIFDQGPTTSIGDVTVAPSNANIVWVGTGEANIFRSSNAGAGVWKSTDAGRSFQHMGLADTYTIPRIVIHPQNPDIVYVAASGHEWTDNAERGVYRSSNGGRTWEKVLYVNERTGAIDLALDPRDPNTLYAATWQRVRRKWNDPRTEPGYSHSGIWKSTDGGRNWRQINEGLPDAQHRGRIGLAIARSNPRVVYAFVDNYEIARQAEPGQLDAYGRPAAAIIKGASVFRSDNGGTSWRQVSANDRYMENASGTYGWVFGQIRVDPNDENKVFFMGLGLNVSRDGGRTWRSLDGMHGDHHGLWIDPANSNYMINNNDGGTYVSYDAGENWRFFVDIPAVQFFNVQYDMATPFHVYGSIQDHGSRRAAVDLSRGRNNIRAVEWEDAPGGEGTNHAIDPNDPNIVYSTSFYGNISRTDLRSGQSVNITPQPRAGELAFRGQWLTPFILSPHNPNVLYHGFQMLHRSTDRGATWERISGDLSYNDSTRYGDIPYQTIFSIAESPLRFGLIYAGTDDGRVHVTQDAGRTWNEVATNLPRGRFVAELVASKYDEGTAYLALNGKRDDDFTPYLYKSTDYGRTWTSIAGNIALGPINVIKEDPKNRNVLYVGMDGGVYVSVDGGQNWNVLATGLPSTYVHDLVIHPRDDIMVAATHGRGMYAVDVRPIQQLTPQVMAGNVAVLQPGEPALLSPGGGRGGFGGGPLIPATTYYWLKTAGAATITVRDGQGNTVRQLTGTGDAGLNMVSWNLQRGADGGGPPQGQRGGGGNTAQPGVYTVEVRQGSSSATGWIQVSR
jgi:photosystem II stability/assembly factor-like uncharacterized protein